jgi:hypothetical protein
MSALDQLEAFLQGLLERPAGFLMPRSMQPIQLASAITKALENGERRLPDRIVVPNAYELLIADADLQKLGSARPALERQLAEYVERVAAERELSLPADPSVRIRSSVDLHAGQVRAVAIPTSLGATPPVPTMQTAAGRGLRNASLSLLAPDGASIRRFRVNPPSATLGRRSNNDVPLPDLKVSRQHARIENSGSSWSLIDLKSRNGTRLNGETVSVPSPLHHNDIIEIGLSRLRFELAEERS